MWMKVKGHNMNWGKKRRIKINSFSSEGNSSCFITNACPLYNYRNWNVTVMYNHKARFPSLCDMKNIWRQHFPINKIAFFNSHFNARYQSCDRFYYSKFSFDFWQTACIQFEIHLYISPILWTSEFADLFLFSKEYYKW